MRSVVNAVVIILLIMIRHRSLGVSRGRTEHDSVSYRDHVDAISKIPILCLQSLRRSGRSTMLSLNDFIDSCLLLGSYNAISCFNTKLKSATRG